MIAQLVDGSVAGGPDGQLGLGDFIEFGQYPTSFAGSGLAGFINEDFASFNPQSFVVQSIELFDFEGNFVLAQNAEVLFITFLSGTGTGIGTSLFESSNGQERLLVSASPDEIALTDVINSTFFAVETVRVDAGLFSSESRNFDRQANGGDQPYIDVDLFIPSP